MNNTKNNTDFEKDVMDLLEGSFDEATPLFGIQDTVPLMHDGIKSIVISKNILPIGPNHRGRVTLADIMNDGMPSPSGTWPAWVITALLMKTIHGNLRFNLFFFFVYNGMSPYRAGSLVFCTSVDLYRYGKGKALSLLSEGYDTAAYRQHDQMLKEWLSGVMLNRAEKQVSKIHGTETTCYGKQVYDLHLRKVVNVGKPPFDDFESAREIYFLAEVHAKTGSTFDTRAFINFICHPEFPLIYSKPEYYGDLCRAKRRAEALLQAVSNSFLPSERLLLQLPWSASTAAAIHTLAEANKRARKLTTLNIELEQLASLDQEDINTFFETGASLPLMEKTFPEFTPKKIEYVTLEQAFNNDSTEPSESSEDDDEEDEDEIINISSPPSKKRKHSELL